MKKLSCCLLLALGCGDSNPGGVTPDAAPPTPDAAPTPDGHVAPPCTARHLNPAFPWYGTNRARLDAMLDALGCESPTYDPAHKPVAVFDWDNTVVKNDVGDATVFWLIKNGKILQPPNQDWKQTSRFMTDAGAAALAAACGTTVPAGQPLPTGTDTTCADAIFNAYDSGSAFAGEDYRKMEPAYAWAAQLMAGYTLDEQRAFAAQAISENLAAAIGATQTVGTTTGLNGYVRIYDQQRDLIDKLQDSGFDVWIVSASPQTVVEPAAGMVGVAADHVVGIRSLVDASGKANYHLAGCGSVADGDDAMITYIDGKRCWINKVIFGDATAAAEQKRPDGHRQAFSAGDSNTDVTFTRDAEYLKLVLNRNKKELMCNAYNNAGGKWIINPMFIAPKPMGPDYPCPTTACFDVGDNAIPCMDELAQPIPVEHDTIFGG